jgi:hypothetical protein
MVYLPVVLVCFLITLIYFSYIFTYIVVLLNPNGNTLKSVLPPDFLLQHTSSPESSHVRGVFLLCFISFFLAILMISILRTVMSDPGYFPSPLELEHKIILKNFKNKKDYQSYISNFKETVTTSPMTYVEGVKLRNEIKNYVDPSNSQEETQLVVGETLDKDKNSTNSKDLFEKYKNVDFNKVILCSSCLRLKIERSHHCRLCGRCVLKMDHHCPWLANCIGFKNYKYFLLVHLYGIISTLIVALSYWEIIVNLNMRNDSNILLIWYTLFVYVVNFGLMSFLIWLFWHNWALMFSGQSVIENSDRERFPSKDWENMYDLGYYKNFTAVFGTNPFVWFLPFFSNYEGEGIFFETKKLMNENQ